jgi:hypothetical protein
MDKIFINTIHDSVLNMLRFCGPQDEVNVFAAVCEFCHLEMVKETKSNDQIVTCCEEAHYFRMHFECFISCHSIMHVATIRNSLEKLKSIVTHFCTMK